MTPELLAGYFQAIANSLPWWVLILGASIGHGYLFIVALNVLYARRLPHELLKYTRKADLLIVAVGPVLFALAIDLFGTRQLVWEAGNWRSYLAGYTVVCWIVGFGVAPVFEICYLLRRSAPQLVSQKSVTIDVARELGYRPCGHGKDARASKLP